MKSSELITYLKDIGFSNRVENLSLHKQFDLKFEEPLRVNESEEIYSLFSLGYVVWVNLGESDNIRLDDISEESQVIIFEGLESGNWDFV